MPQIVLLFFGGGFFVCFQLGKEKETFFCVLLLERLPESAQKIIFIAQFSSTKEPLSLDFFFHSVVFLSVLFSVCFSSKRFRFSFAQTAHLAHSSHSLLSPSLVGSLAPKLVGSLASFIGLPSHFTHYLMEWMTFTSIMGRVSSIYKKRVHSRQTR